MKRRNLYSLPILLTILLLSFQGSTASADDAVVMIKDIISGSGGSEPELFTRVNGTLFFSADDGIHGRELWKSDGTVAGTVMVKDIAAGRQGSIKTIGLSAITRRTSANVNGTLFFVANDGTHGPELWKSDGTATGTVMVNENGAFSGLKAPESLTSVNGKLFFVIDVGTYGSELWTSDGTAAGTVMVKDINPLSTWGSNPQNLIEMNGLLYFKANDSTHGDELWRSDGTAAGTMMVKDIQPGLFDANIGSPVVVNGKLFFSAYDDLHGTELWKSDGSAAGTVLVKDINPGYPWSVTSDRMAAVGGCAYFIADDGTRGPALWKSDGTAAGTVLVKDIRPETSASIIKDIRGLTALNGQVFFTVDDGSSGRELWRSDGTTTGTVMVKDINPQGDAFTPTDLNVACDKLYFVATDGTHGLEPWQSDGTAAGTVMLADVNPGYGDSGTAEFTEIFGTLFFAAGNNTYGSELWRLANKVPVEFSSFTAE